MYARCNSERTKYNSLILIQNKFCRLKQTVTTYARCNSESKEYNSLILIQNIFCRPKETVTN